MEDIRVEYINFEDISKWPRNPKDHDIEEIRKSFVRFGFIKPVLVDEGSKQLVAGHGRLDTLKKIKLGNKKPPRGVKIEEGRWMIPVLRGVEFENVDEAEAFLVADNRLGELGGWNKDLLAEVLEDMVMGEQILEGTGFDHADVEKLLSDIAKRDALFNEEAFKKTKEELRTGIYITVGFCDLLIQPESPYFDIFFKFAGTAKQFKDEDRDLIISAIGEKLNERRSTE